MYPSLSQKKQFRELLVETQSESRFQKARDGELPHFVVKTASPDKFVEFVGEAAKERFQTEYAEHLSKNGGRSEEHTSELQTLMRISYAVFCLKKKIQHTRTSSTRLTKLHDISHIHT